MRFAELWLERYGRFDGQRLCFAAGQTDFHIIYGPNEAGKSTTLAAVSDLLFGIPQISPYNFRFDYALMRIGAVLEEDGQRFVCRRRKARDKSLIDEADQPVDEGRLAALLHGVTRETFGSGFSLDQTGLRRGGEAMVKANDDLGQALFAAGSGLSGIAALQAALDAECAAIWTPKARDRTFTNAKRQYEDSQRNQTEHLLRPTEWAKARADVERLDKEFKALKDRQKELSAELRTVERLRRIGATMRQRAALLAEIVELGDGPTFTSMVEERAEAALAAHAEATAAHDVAAKLRDEAAEKLLHLSADPITDLSDNIGRLVEQRGAVNKGAEDQTRLEAESHLWTEEAATLRRDLRIDSDPPSAASIAKLRTIAERYVKAETSRQTREESLTDPRAKVRKLQTELADAPLPEGLGPLRAAITQGTGLGDDYDGRCAETLNAAERAETDAATALVRLSPWKGDADALARLQTLSEAEIQAAQEQEQRFTAGEEEERREQRRLDEEIERKEADRSRLTATGQAVAAEDIVAARADRDRHWRDIEAHLLHRTTLPSPVVTGDAFSTAQSAADDLADRRFDTADASARLGMLDDELAALSQQQEQMAKRLADTRTLAAAAKQEWRERLATLDLPDLAPLRLRQWQTWRDEALAKHRTAQDARSRANHSLERRAEAITRLRGAMESPPPATDRLSLLLERAEDERAVGENLEQAFLKTQTTLAGLEEQIATTERLLEQDKRQAEKAQAEWQTEPAATGLTLDADHVGDRLTGIEALRAKLDAIGSHEKRIDGIIRDRGALETAVNALAEGTGTTPDADPSRTLDLLRTRLSQAQATARTIEALQAERDRRQQEVDTAHEARRKALSILAPVMAQAGLDDAATLPTLIDRSRQQRQANTRLAETERQIMADGDGHALIDLVAAWEVSDPDATAARAGELERELAERNEALSAAADALGEARRTFTTLDTTPGTAAADAADGEAALAEMAAQAEVYVLKRAQSLMLRWAMERYRERRQDPLLRRASELFHLLTLGRFSALRVDYETPTPRLLGLRDDGETLVPISGMSEGTTDQLFLALRLAAVEQSTASGVRLPFLADDLFVNFDDERSQAGLRVLAELAQTTQVLFFTHHAHLCDLARRAIGADVLTEHALG